MDLNSTAPSYDEDSLPSSDAGKQDQAAVNYRKGSPVSSCGLCTMFEGAAHGSCTAVNGQITPFGVCDLLKLAKNPYGSVLGPQERAMIDHMTQSPPDQSPYVQPAAPANPTAPPGLQIGSRRYGG